MSSWMGPTIGCMMITPSRSFVLSSVLTLTGASSPLLLQLKLCAFVAERIYFKAHASGERSSRSVEFVLVVG